ncbi:MAG: ABC transporter permease [Acidobacteria bacterium]|nr:ABC transporter permease [Acidobacteriota bacterium]
MVADAKLELKPGDRVRLGLHEYDVVGLVRGAVDSGGNPLVYVSWPDAQEILYQRDNEALRNERAAALRQLEAQGYTPTEAARVLPLVTQASVRTISAVLVRLSPGMDPHAVAAHIRSGLFVNAYTTDEEKELMLKGRLFRMTQILWLFRALLIVVSVVVIALLLYVLTMEKIKSIATLKLIGAQNSMIVRLILEQSLVITVASFFLGYALISATHEKFPRTLVFIASDTALTFAVIFAGGVMASLLGIIHALRTPPSLALGG